MFNYKEVDEEMDNLYKRCLGRIDGGNSCKLMFVEFKFQGGGIGIDYYIYPFEKNKFKNDSKELKSIINLEKVINCKEELDSIFDLLYNKYVY